MLRAAHMLISLACLSSCRAVKGPVSLKIVWMASEIEFWPPHTPALLPTPHTFSPASCYAIPALQRCGRKIKAILGRYFFLMEKSAVVTPGLRCREHSFNPAFENHGTVFTVQGSILLLCCQENRTVTLCLGPCRSTGLWCRGCIQARIYKRKQRMKMDGWDSAWAWGGVSLYRSRAREKNVYLVSLLWREKLSFGS